MASPFKSTIAALCILLAAAAAVRGENVSELLAEYDQRLAELESEVQKYGVGPSHHYSVENCGVEPSAYAGFSFLFAKPHLKESFEATVTNVGAGTLQLIPLDTDYELTPRVWLGANNGNGVGIRATYWQYDHNGNPQNLVSDGVNLPGATVTTVIFPAAIIAPAPGDVLSTSNSLELHTVDLEGTLDIVYGSLQATVGGGIRYARIEQLMSAEATRGVVSIGSLDWQREMEGIGPMISADVRKCLTGELSALARGRASLLFGDKTLRRTVVGDITPPASAAPPNVQLNNADEVTAALELGLGFEWKRELASGRQVFLQGLYEGQLWTESGAPTLTFLGFEGFSLSTGVIF